MARKDYSRVSYNRAKEVIIEEFSTLTKDRFQMYKNDFLQSAPYGQLIGYPKVGLSGFMQRLEEQYHESERMLRNIDLFLQRMLNNYQAIFTGLEVKNTSSDISEVNSILEKVKHTSQFDRNYESKKNPVVLEFTPEFSNYETGNGKQASVISTASSSIIDDDSKLPSKETSSVLDIDSSVLQGFTYGNASKL